MIKMSFMRWAVPCLLLLASPAGLLAMDRYDLLVQARSFESRGDEVAALEAFTDYIATHPALTGKKTAAYKKNPQYYLRNLLIAFSGLLEIQQKLGQTEGIRNNTEKLKAIQQDNLFGSKNLYSLAKIYRNAGAISEALACLRTIIDDQVRTPRKSNNKVFVRACQESAEVYQEIGREGDREAVILVLAGSLEQLEFDFKDRYQVGRILLANNREVVGKRVLEDIVRDAQSGRARGEEDAVVRSLVKLLGIQGADPEGMTPLLAAMDQLSAGTELGSSNRYALGIACLNAGEEKRGIALLEGVKKEFPETISARKALFVLGRKAASSSDWDRAIACYSEYVDRYPEPRFFSLKAYSRLIDCQWAKLKDPDLIASEAQHLADVVNDIADFETQLNLARDLKEKGFDELAEATFGLGMVEARNRLQEASQDEERLRILCAVQKYAYPLEKFSLVEDSARQALDLLNGSRKEMLSTSERGRYYKSQTYIWLGQTYRKTARDEAAITTLSEFLNEFPESRDADYVRYTLAEILDEKGDRSRAKGLYDKVAAGIWKERAANNLKTQGQAQ
jgi:tetratricopeptide (TPR) repeat protein